MTPYYEHGGITIYHGDCRDVIEQWEGLRTQPFDLLLTDPPYGIGVAKTGRVGSDRRTKSNGYAVLDATDFGDVTWDGDTCADVMPRLRALAVHQIIFGGNYYDLPPSRCWLVWDKANEATDFADCELAWTNLDKAVRKLTFRWNGMLQGAGVPKEQRLHPTMKPEPVMRWALIHVPGDVKTVLDPFMGSGTTLVAAKRLGRQAVGIEREERYCEIAAKRLAQEVLPLEMPA
jgi:site-specific DNA-methyltransferase (adenine-specific)